MLARHNIRPMFVPALEEDWIYKTGNTVKPRFSWHHDPLQPNPRTAALPGSFPQAILP